MWAALHSGAVASVTALTNLSGPETTKSSPGASPHGQATIAICTKSSIAGAAFTTVGAGLLWQHDFLAGDLALVQQQAPRSGRVAQQQPARFPPIGSAFATRETPGAAGRAIFRGAATRACVRDNVRGRPKFPASRASAVATATIERSQADNSTDTPANRRGEKRAGRISKTSRECKTGQCIRAGCREQARKSSFNGTTASRQFQAEGKKMVGKKMRTRRTSLETRLTKSKHCFPVNFIFVDHVMSSFFCPQFFCHSFMGNSV